MAAAKRDKERGKRRWTAAGAARAARDARIATTAFLRDAPVMREWHASKMLLSHQVLVSHMRREVPHDEAAYMSALRLLLAGLGYPASWRPSSMAEVVETVLADEARYLADADLYVLSPQMCDVVTAAAQTLTLEDRSLITEQDLPSRSGLLVLPYPLLVRAINGELGDDRAILWHTTTQLETPAVRVSLYHDTHGPVRPDSFLDFADRTRTQGHPLPPLLLDAIRCIPFDQPLSDEQRSSYADYTDTAHQVGDAYRTHSRTVWNDEDRVIGEYVPGTEIDDPDDTFATRFAYAFWRLCEQHIATIGHAEVGHAARVTAERAGVSPEVRVVQLRTANPSAPADADGDDDAVEPATDTGERWHHRWVVRMHKVRQWYPSEQRHKVIYRGPYLKGPENKPLLGGEVVRGLTR